MNEFESRVHAADPNALYATGAEVLQVNVGLRCNMRCTHCHQSSSPERTEQMDDATLAATLALARRLQPSLVDVTGGAPELHPGIRDFVVALRTAGLPVQLRTNLTVLDELGCRDLPDLWAQHGVGLLASLPSPDDEPTARQRGARALARSIAVLRRLNELGYGVTDRLRLDIAANPDGTELPDAPDASETRFRRELAQRWGVRFHRLRTLTNMPIGRFRESLLDAGCYTGYVQTLAEAFNPATLPLLACRTTLVVGWDGRLCDCDFNLGAGLPVRGDRRRVADVDETLLARRIAFGPHCFACTARAGSS